MSPALSHRTKTSIQDEAKRFKSFYSCNSLQYPPHNSIPVDITDPWEKLETWIHAFEGEKGTFFCLFKTVYCTFREGLFCFNHFINKNFFKIINAILHHWFFLNSVTSKRHLIIKKKNIRCSAFLSCFLWRFFLALICVWALTK